MEANHYEDSFDHKRNLRGRGVRRNPHPRVEGLTTLQHLEHVRYLKERSNPVSDSPVRQLMKNGEWLCGKTERPVAPHIKAIAKKIRERASK